MGQQTGPPEAPAAIASRPALDTINNTSALVAVRDESLDSEEPEAVGEEGDKGTVGNRWPRQETLALLKIRSDMDTTFRDSSLKGPVWEEVSRKLAEMGYHRSAKKCKEKFENLHKYYKRTKGGKAGRQDGKSYRFFSQLDALYGKTTDTTSNPAGNKGVAAPGMSPASAANRVSGGSFGIATNAALKTREPLVNSTPVAPRSSWAAGERPGSVPKPESDMSSGLNFSTDSSDDELEENCENPESKKRKRKSSKKYLLFFQSAMKKVLDKQDQMQRKFLEALERRDQDRIIREEAWKRQEMARLNREHELRAQESAFSASRDAALIAYLQKITGQTLQLPQVVPLQQAPPSTAIVPAEAQDNFQRDNEYYDPSSKRWPKPEVLALIKLRTELDPKFHEPGSKALLWEEISSAMSAQGYNRTSKRCKEKWENINKYFKKAKENNKKRPENAKTCPYFHQLDTLYKEGVLGGSHIKQTLMIEKAEQSENLLEQPNGSNTRDDSEQAQEGDSEILANNMPSGDNDPATISTRNVEIAAPNSFVNSENGNSSGIKNVENQPQMDSANITPSATMSALPPSLERINSGKSFSGPNRPMHTDQVQL